MFVLLLMNFGICAKPARCIRENMPLKKGSRSSTATPIYKFYGMAILRINGSALWHNIKINQRSNFGSDTEWELSGTKCTKECAVN